MPANMRVPQSSDNRSRGALLEHLPYRIASHYAAIKQILNGGMPWPRFAIVYPVQGCNLKCVHCEYAELNSGPLRLVEFDKFVPALETLQSHGLEGVEFCGGGEPTLHPQLVDFARTLRERGVYVGLLTNGFGLNERDMPTVAATFSYLRVSLDAATPETFARVKGCPSNMFAKVVSKLETLLDERAQSGARVEVGLKVCLTTHNVYEIESCADLAERLGVDSIQYKPARNCPAQLDCHALENASKVIAAIRSDPSRRCTVMGGADKSTIDFRCFLTPLNVVVDTDGSVYLCCYFSHRRKKHCIGNVFQDDMASIWGGERHVEAIRNISPAECNVYDCRFDRYNRLVRDTMVDGNGFWSFL